MNKNGLPHNAHTKLGLLNTSFGQDVLYEPVHKPNIPPSNYNLFKKLMENV